MIPSGASIWAKEAPLHKGMKQPIHRTRRHHDRTGQPRCGRSAKRTLLIFTEWTHQFESQKTARYVPGTVKRNRPARVISKESATGSVPAAAGALPSALFRFAPPDVNRGVWR